MKVTCTKTNLKTALNLASRVVSPTATLPILNNLLLKAESGQLQVSATNLEMALKIFLGGQVAESGQITVPAKTVAEYVNNTKEEKII
ncbi:MAG: DNA polymerase III subunit beta, partial [Candidatus Doudnabacteria bacterium]|nr:DNA polymerase III subunit beta [Candidatus Doudnabacteria bacterium]